VALLLGIWMVIHTLRSQGPEIRIVFASAEGIEADKTKIKLRSVEVGLVESVGLGDDLESVVVTARLEKAASPLLREDTQFWVVRPRVGPGGISGLGTLLSGGYIQLAPGTGEPGRREFEGLEVPPVTPAGTPGLQFELLDDRAGSVSSGDPILYRGFRVGRIESADFDVESQQMRYSAFIEAPYDDLVTSTTRFWNASGISLRASAEGLQVDAASLESLLAGGVAFGLPEGVAPGEKVESGARFELYDSHASVNEQPYRYALEYVVRFPQSVRGLQPGAPVEYRGLPVGKVERVMLSELTAQGIRGRGDPIPVLLRLEPGRLELPDSEQGIQTLSRVVETAVGNGLRATLQTGSLLTGSLYVSLDMYPNEPRAELGSFAGHPTIPTVASGLAGIEQRLTALLDKINALPLEDTVEQAEQTLADLNAILGSEAARNLPRSIDASLLELRSTLASVGPESGLADRLNRTLTELERTLQSLQQLTGTLAERPNALIFSADPEPDPEPSAGAP
jgi:paraquat-inducible protein B